MLAALADSFTMCQTAFSVMASPHALPTLPCGTLFLDQFQPQPANCSVRFAPNREPEQFEHDHLCLTNPQLPNAPHVAEDDRVSKPQLRASLNRKRAVAPALLGHVFL